MPAGGPRPNSGRKTNKSKLLDQQACVEAMGTWFTLDFQKSKWLELLDSDVPIVQQKAMAYLSDRIYGKAAMSLEVSGSLEIGLSDRISKARERV